jgi:hypothetical protein
MARPPQYDRDPYDDAPVNTAAVKAMVKRLDEPGRALLLAWICMYYEDDGKMFSPQISRRRQRIAIDGVEYWLVRVPKRGS